MDDTRYKDYFRFFTEISKKIHTNTKTTDILACIAEHITLFLEARGCIFWILNRSEKEIETKISYGFDYRSLSLTDYNTLSTLFPPDSCGPITITDARNDKRIPDLERLGKHLINGITGIYFDIAGPYTGLVAVYFTGNRDLNDDELSLFTALGEQGAIALDRALGYDQEMLNLYGQIIEGFALAIEARDTLTHGHSITVARLAQATARQMDLGEKESDRIRHAALLHDIGKIGTRDHILDRLGKLTKKEMHQIRKHPVLGADILRPLVFLDGIEPLVRSHHELFDGSGYPDGKKGDQIPLGARIITVCDAFETMISGRPGIPKQSLTQALEGLKKGACARFDPEVVTAFFQMIKNNDTILDTAESVDQALENLTRNMERTADQNRIEKKLANPFTSFF